MSPIPDAKIMITHNTDPETEFLLVLRNPNVSYLGVRTAFLVDFAGHSG